MTHTSRLLSWLPRFLSRDPEPFRAARFRYDGGGDGAEGIWHGRWQVQDGTLTLTGEQDQIGRATPATYFRGDGSLREVAAYQPRYRWNQDGSRGAMIREAAGVNYQWNPRGEGLVAGTPGALPTYWGSGGIFGQQVVGAATETGIPGFDLRISGTTPAGGSYWWLQPAGWLPSSYVSAVPKQTWTFSIYLRVIAGVTPAGSSIRMQIDWFNASGTNFSSVASNITITGEALRTQRVSITGVAPANTARVGVSVAQNLSGSQAVDLTLRIGAPQVEIGDAMTSLILPPAGAPAISTRAAESLPLTRITHRTASLDLSAYTLATLMGAVASARFTGSLEADAAQSQLSALTLLDATGDQDQSNGDLAMGWTSILLAYMGAIARDLDLAADRIDAMLAQLNIQTAEAEWLNELGAFYGVTRDASSTEPDPDYRKRLVAEVLAPRGNNVAIAQAILDQIGQTTTVIDVATFGATSPIYNGVATHNGIAHYNSTPSIRYGLFDVVTGYDLLSGVNPVTFAANVTAFVERMRDAGTHMRSIVLSGGAITDTAPNPDDGGALAFQMQPTLTDTGLAPDDSALAWALALDPATTDAVATQADTASLSVTYAITYNGTRLHNGEALYRGGTVLEFL